MKLPATGWLTGRAIEEWSGSSPNAAIPSRVIVRLFMRQCGKCAVTGARLVKGRYQADHIKPLKAGGRHAESNLQLITSGAHKAKTKAEAGERAKVNRVSQKAFGLKKTARPIPGSKASGWKKSISGKVTRR